MCINKDLTVSLLFTNSSVVPMTVKSTFRSKSQACVLLQLIHCWPLLNILCPSH